MCVSEGEPEDVLFARQDASVANGLAALKEDVPPAAPRRVGVNQRRWASYKPANDILRLSGLNAPHVYRSRFFERKYPSKVFGFGTAISKSQPIELRAVLVEDDGEKVG